MENNSLIIRQARKYAKHKSVANSKNLRIAVIGSYSTQHISMVLKYLLHEECIETDIYEGQYNGIAMDVLDKSSDLYMFKPDIVIVFPYHEDIHAYPDVLETQDKVERRINLEVDYYKKIWSNLSENEGVHIIQTNFVIPPLRQYGNMEKKLWYSASSFLTVLNQRILMECPANVTIVDLDGFASDVGKYNWFDYSAYFLYKLGFKMDYLPEVCKLLVRQILVMQGKTRKCLVLDLDNTVWGGIIGDDGCEGIRLDPNDAVGEAYRFFQKYVLSLKNRGVILAVCSKNEESIAKTPFEKNKNMILKLDDIACFVANWDDKVQNLRRIAEKLNIGLDSMVFFDDNPAERKLVHDFLPMVHVVDVPEDPAYYAIQIEKESPFEWQQLTQEDVIRNTDYNSNEKREKLRESIVDYDVYLRALEMKGRVCVLSTEYVQRFTQLINKSNQFNVRTIRYSETGILKYIHDQNYKCLYSELEDKFGNHGLISCVILRREGADAFIDTWVMSCRVLKRGVEEMMFEQVLEEIKKWGCETLYAEYIETNKNALVRHLYDQFGFLQISSDEEAKSIMYRLTDFKFTGAYNITKI